ncbi:ABC transporter ATP-binding protein/permease [Glycomyces sp. L485]|uniref:ABC transporter ATP-binding protein n=1 Tax=Glycomyces sp. L485 TaxID=2909235 RepID=UPI001F4BAE7F|nr:ABC transporter ATP-binding protein [Glycomyces sp. L485]MCH7232287.1 ABC transporter ATP-binding protein/permease [Glycomyces sp. L485]
MIIQKLPVAAPKQTRAYLRELVGRHRWRFALIVALTIMAALAAMGAPYVVGIMTEGFASWAAGGPDPGSDLPWQLGLILASVLVQAGLAWAAHRQLAVLSEQVGADVREEFLERVLALPPGQIEAAGTGDLLGRTNLDVGQLQHSITSAAPKFFTGFVSVLVYVAGAFVVSPVLGLTILVAVPPMLLVLRWYFKRAFEAFHAVQAAGADLTATVAETIDGIKTVEAFGWQRRRVALTDQAIDRKYAARMRMMRLQRVLFPVLDFSAFLPCLTVLVVGGYLTATGRLSLAETTTVVLIMQLAVAPAVEMIISLQQVQIGGVSLARLVGVQAENAIEGGGLPDREAEEIIELKGVGFGYDPERPVLHGVDLVLRRGERLALVGPTGAGKSTLARLMAGIHRPDRGAVHLGGAEAGTIDEDTLRRFIILATQEYHLFNDTLASNLRLGAPDAEDGHLLEALEAVGAGDLPGRLEDGLETKVGGRDHALTPAEIQQVALARVILAKPEVIVLDEATSMLSPNAASGIEQGLSRILAGRTVVGIAHRLNTAHDADRVAVVERGRITELGSHDELLARGGSYAALWRRWHG